MNRTLSFLLLVFFFIQTPACLITPPDPPPILWMKAFDFKTNTPIRNLHAAPLEILIISDDELIRMEPENKIKERRVLPVPFEFYSWPVLADHTFTRIVRDQANGGPIIELHLVAAPNSELKIPYENLKEDATDIYAPISKSGAEHSLAYNDDGTQLIIPVVNFSGNSHVFFLIDIQLDFSKTKFLNVDKSKRIDIPEIPGSVTDRVSNIVYENGHYYVISLDGTFRISPDGTYERVIPGWLYDVFAKNDTLYATGRGRDLYTSTDNGLNWKERAALSDIKFAEVVRGKEILSQNFPWAMYQMADTGLEEVKSLTLNEEFPNEVTSNAYAKLIYFYNAHYLTVQKELYFSCGLQTEEE